MEFIEFKENYICLLRIRVKPDSRAQGIYLPSKTDYWLVVNLKSKPVKNKANKELINLIRKRLDIPSTQIKIISGLKKSSKILEIKLNEDIGRVELINKLIG